MEAHLAHISQVGNAAAMTHDEWESDITLAKEAHIDGFALNIGPQDSYTDDVLRKAYDAAAAVGDFTLFLSFDYLSGGPWPIDRVIQTINSYKDKPAQFKYKNKPLVSTFEGVNNIYDWESIKPATGCFFMPSWTSLGPHGHERVMNIIDGAFSWDAWPEGAQSKSTGTDEAYLSLLCDKPYMMPVSPWFYTDLPQWGKNWLWRGDDLWHDRWQQVIELQPAMVQIITWNDFGEAHYIGPIREPGIPEGAAEYVARNPHDAWRALLPVYIDLYKSNNASNPAEAPIRSHAVYSADSLTYGDNRRECPNDSKSEPIDIITYWYRLNPSAAGSSGGTTGNNPGHGQQALDPGLVSQDRVFTSILVAEPSEITIRIGQSPPTRQQAKTAGINHFSVPFNNQKGIVEITVWREGKPVVSTTGPEITDACANGKVNWNAYVGSSLRD
ncbi:aminopeptidase I [Blastomyces parvus]|uniref:Aminopeptidase I n=1 Tax=Blastomyces parvus TaxID=2060905 RepID=A0A2B7XF03_9EURO|nr:aminopeptidase I [Blastomyces parvus]